MTRRVFVAMALLLTAALNAADDSKLVSARITFSVPQGDEKDAKDEATAVTVTVKSKADQTLATKERLGADDVWDDTNEKGFSYDLTVAPGATRSQIGDGVAMQLRFHPNGNDIIKFNYHLVLKFEDGQELTKDGAGIVLSQFKLLYNN